MELFLGIVIFSFSISAISLVPFIDFLYRIRFTHTVQLNPLSPLETKEFADINRQHLWKLGTPVGGGLLLIALVSGCFWLLFPFLRWLGVEVSTVYPFKEEINIIFFTFISFGLLGFYDDIVKTFGIRKHLMPNFIFGYKSLFQVILAATVSFMMYYNLDIQILNIPGFAVTNLGWGFIPLSTGVILFITRSFDITDGLDGLAAGLLLVCLLAFWAVSVTALDTVLSIFIALWIGALVAFLYFNVYPARIWLGNSGSLAFGATLAVTALLLGKTFGLFVIGGIFVVEGVWQGLQLLSVKFFHTRLFKVSPPHYWLIGLGWSEPKVVIRLWLLAVFLAFCGLWLAGL